MELTEEQRILYWINSEIPDFLDKFDSHDEFLKAMPSTCASGDWKYMAHAMAKERWRVKKLTVLYR